MNVACGSLFSLLERLTTDLSLCHKEYGLTVLGAVVNGVVEAPFVVQYDKYYPPPCYCAVSIAELLMVVGESRALSCEWVLVPIHE